MRVTYFVRYLRNGTHYDSIHFQTREEADEVLRNVQRMGYGAFLMSYDGHTQKVV